MKYELIAPCHFGTETCTKKEIQQLGYEITEVSDGKVCFSGDERAIARSNIFLRTTERILIKVGSFKATTFDELFEGTKALPWEKFIPADGKFWVAKASSVRSKLFSPSDIQSIMKKAIVERLRAGKRAAMFCIGGHGRTGYVAACVLHELGYENPIGFLRKNYSLSAVESEEQEQAVERFCSGKKT